MKELDNSKDMTYESVNLSIFATSEVFIGAFTASLPPLRKTFENTLRKVLPTSLTGGSGKGSKASYALENVGGSKSSKSWNPTHEMDADSELGILPANEAAASRTRESDQSIMKTTHVSVTEVVNATSPRQPEDWA